MDQKPLDVKNTPDLRSRNIDVQGYGNPDQWVLLCKASSEAQGWMKSTKVLNVPGGCVLQVTTQQRNPGGTSVVAEALTYVPHVAIDVDAVGTLVLVERYSTIEGRGRVPERIDC